MMEMDKIDVLDIVPNIPARPATELMKVLLDMEAVNVVWRDAADGELPEDKDGHVNPYVGGPKQCNVVVRPGIDSRLLIWIIGHEMLHHCQYFRLWPPEEEFVETIDLLLMYALKGLVAQRHIARLNETIRGLRNRQEAKHTDPGSSWEKFERELADWAETCDVLAAMVKHERDTAAELRAALRVERRAVDVLAQAMPRDVCPNTEHDWYPERDGLSEDDCGSDARCCWADSAQCWADFARSEWAQTVVHMTWKDAELRAVAAREQEAEDAE